MRMYQRNPESPGAAWTIELRTCDRRLVRLTAFKDRPASEIFGRCIARLAECKKNHEPLSTDLAAWIEGLPERLKDGLAKARLLDAVRVAAGRPLAEHLAAWRSDL